MPGSQVDQNPPRTKCFCQKINATILSHIRRQSSNGDRRMSVGRFRWFTRPGYSEDRVTRRGEAVDDLAAEVASSPCNENLQDNLTQK